MRLLERAMLRTGIALRFTQGFNPRPKFATSPAIPLGMSSRSEYVQFEMYGEIPPDLVGRMNECLMEGLVIQSIEPFEAKGQWSITQPLQASYRANMNTEALNGESDMAEDIVGRVNDLINHLADHRKGNDFWCSSKAHDLISDLSVLSESPLQIGFTVSVNPESGAMLKPRDFLEHVLACPPEVVRKFVIAKDAVSFV
jgi:radical SAM-linked protein